MENAWKVILATLVIFVAGVATGGLLVILAVRVSGTQFGIQLQHKPAVTVNTPAANPWLSRNKDLLRRMDREMDLTPEQHTKIEAIIAASQERTKYLWKPIVPQMNKELQMVHGEIRDLLTPDQKKKFDDFRLRPNPEKRHGGSNFFNTNLISTNVVVTNAAQ